MISTVFVIKTTQKSISISLYSFVISIESNGRILNIPILKTFQMSNLLIGSSNVNRFYKSTEFSGIRTYKMVKCTQMAGFTAYMQSLPKDSETVLISVFENFVVDAVGADIAEPEAAIDKCIKDFLKTILSSAQKLPNTRFGVVMPLGRPAVRWYQERLAPITKFLNCGLGEMLSDNVNNVTGIMCSLESSQQFEPDMIHLTKNAGRIFLETVLEAAEKSFSAPLVDLTEPGEIHAGADQEQIRNLESRLALLENYMRAQSDKNVGNDLMFARSREETDSVTNKAKEDRVLVNGLKSASPLPSDQKLKIEALKLIVGKIFEMLIPGFDGKIVYLIQGKTQGQPIPMVEVKMDTPEQAISLRKAFAEKKKNKSLGAEYESLFMANCVSLATRVRVDVLKAIARRVTSRDDLAYVAGFTSRPMMHIRKAGLPSPATRPLKSFSYIDAVTRFGHLVKVDDLETAYGRAGKSFNGQLQQNFVILNERDQASLQSVTRSTAPYPATSGGASGRGGSGSGPVNRGTKRSGSTLVNESNKK